MLVYVVAYIFTYLHIFPQSVDGKVWDEGSEYEKGSVVEGGKNGLLQSEFLFLSNFMEGTIYQPLRSDRIRHKVNF